MKRRTASTLDSRKPTLGRRFGSFFCFFIMFYIGFHAVTGEHGAFALFRESRKLETVTAELAAIKAQRAELEGKVKLLSSSSLDLDMLDQQVRRVLGVAGHGEAVIFFDTAKN